MTYDSDDIDHGKTARLIGMLMIGVATLMGAVAVYHVVNGSWWNITAAQQEGEKMEGSSTSAPSLGDSPVYTIGPIIPDPPTRPPVAPPRGHVTASVGNVNDPGLAWNDTPTVGMFSTTTAPVLPIAEPARLKSSKLANQQALVPAAKCSAPTGYLLAMARAWNEGKRDGIIEMNGIPDLDMGSDGGWYDTSDSGCCDTYCRITTKGGYWSCVSPLTPTSQYEAGVPTGTLCQAYGNRSDIVSYLET